MNPNDTPETDGEWNRLATLDNPQFEQAIADFARKLERERNELQSMVNKLKIQLTAALETVAQDRREKQ